MIINTRIGRAEAVGMIENGNVFKYLDKYYIATDDNTDEHGRVCVNVETGEVEMLPTGMVVENFDCATMNII